MPGLLTAAPTPAAPVTAFSMFKTHAKNLDDIKQALDFYGSPVYFHGDGNIYPLDETPGSDHSTNAVKYTNPMGGVAGNPAPGSFRVLFKSKSQVPGTVEEMNALLLTAKGREMQESAQPKASRYGRNIVPSNAPVAAPVAVTGTPVVDSNANELAEMRAEIARVKAENAMLKAAPTTPVADTTPVISEPPATTTISAKAAAKPATQPNA